MGAYRIRHVECVQTREPQQIEVGLIEASSAREARKIAVGRFAPAPDGWATEADEIELSRVLTEWKLKGDAPFAGREDDYDALIMGADACLLDETRLREVMLALADLAEECGAFEVLRETTRHHCGLDVEGWLRPRGFTR